MMPVVILCGGKATRLGDLTKATPKYLVDVCGKPFAWWQLQLLRKQGYTDILLLTGHLHEQIEATIGDGSACGVQVRYQRDIMDGLGTHGALLMAQTLIEPPFFVLYGDSYLECDYAEIEGHFRRQKLDALLTTWQGIDYGLRAFRRYPPRHATFHEMFQPFQEVGSLAGLERLHTYLSGRSFGDCTTPQAGAD